MCLCRPHPGGPVPSLWNSSRMPALHRTSVSCSRTKEPSLPHSLPTFPTPFPPSPRSRGSWLYPLRLFLPEQLLFSSRKCLNIPAFPGSKAALDAGRRRPQPPRPAPSPRSRSLLLIHSFIDSSPHSFMPRPRAAIQGWLPVSDPLGFSSLSILPPRDFSGELRAAPAVCRVLPGAQPGAL